jgi:hypothetical protein
MDTSVTSILQQLRALRELVTHHGMTTEELHRLELELRTIIERIDVIRSIAGDLKHMPELTAEDTKGLDKLEKRLRARLRKTVVIRAECSSPRRNMNMTLFAVMESLIMGLLYVSMVLFAGTCGGAL